MADAPEARPEDARPALAASGPSLPPADASILARASESCALGAIAASIASLPVALRAAGEGASAFGGLLASAAVLTLPLAAAIHLSGAAGRGYRLVTGRGAGRSTAVGIALWAGISAPLLLLLGAGLSVATNHRGLGGATFGALAFGVAVVSALAAHRLVTVGRGLVTRGVAAGRTVERVSLVGAAVPALLAALVALRAADGGPAAARLLASVVDGALAVVAAVLASTFELPPAVRSTFRRLGALMALVVVAAGVVWVERSPDLARAVKARGGLGPAILSALEGWTDRDGDGAGARFGGADCDDGDPRRFHGAPDVDGDHRDDDCDGRDLARSGSVAAADRLAAATPPVGAPPGAPAPRAPDPGTPAGASSPARSGPRSGPPSIVLVTLDAVRADRTSAYGYGKPTTPALAALAARGTRFEHAYSVASDTQRALAPLVSGRRLSRTARDSREWPTLRGSNDTLAERLSRAGYATAAVTSFTWLSKDRGFDQGFDDFEPAYEKDHPERGVTGAHALAAARAILARREEDPRPLFLWVHLFDAHERWLEHPGLDFGGTKGGLYDGEVAFVDRQLAGLVESIAASNRGASTAFVVHGSHGVGLGEHGVDGHGADLWEQQIRVPLIVAVPGGPPARHDAGAVSVADVPATVLELAGAPSEQVEGRSLAAIARGTASPTEPSPPVYARARRRSVVIEWPLKLLTTERRGKDRHLLFDLVADPQEEKDLSGDRQADLTRLLAVAESFERGEADGNR